MDAPFHSFSFSLIRNREGRSLLRLVEKGDGMYELHVESGGAESSNTQFTREVPSSIAQRLKDTLDVVGVVSWEEEYPNDAAAEPLKWSLDIVFKEGVFSFYSHGGNAVPAGFDQLLEELYRLDFPRPDDGFSPEAALSDEGDDAPSPAALFSSMLPEGMGDISPDEFQHFMSEAQSDPQAFFAQIREEYQMLPQDEKERMLDALAQTGLASRAWWENFFRGL